MRLYCSFVLLLGSLHVADATWSIVAAERQTQQVGVAIATCITSEDFYDSFFDRTFTYIPGHAAMVAQSKLQTDDHILGLARDLMRNKTEPSTILASITTEAVDGGEGDGQTTCCSGYKDFSIRQYGIVDMDGAHSAYTGARIDELYEFFNLPGSEQTSQGGRIFEGDDINGTLNYVYSVQGNIVEPGTVAAAANSFSKGGEQGLPDKLMAALEAGAASGLGDVRCTKFFEELEVYGMGTKTALIAYIKVIESNGNVTLDIQARAAGSDIQDDAVGLLRASYDEWKSPQNEDAKNETGEDSKDDEGPNSIASWKGVNIASLLFVVSLWCW